ncbi:MAG: FAD:protein transferase [Solirubrobacteraceae bacterium]|nr:FAD:protein transferase [Solirubrobacteraceae bacterium]
MPVRRRSLQELKLDRRIAIPAGRHGRGPSEANEEFGCFGSTCAAFVIGDTPDRSAGEAVVFAKSFLLGWHERFTRFEPDSELSQFNADVRRVVPVSDALARFAEAVVTAAHETGGLVDGTLLQEIEAAGYRGDLTSPVPLPEALGLAPPRAPAGPSPRAAWSKIAVDRVRGTVTRPVGVALDSGGLAKGLAADLLADVLAGHASFAVDAAGDVRVGGAQRVPRPVQVASPFDGAILHTFTLAHAGVATSGIGRRSWLGADGRPAHHLLDPATGRPAFTGVVQATAIAPTALQAEARAKAAVLSGPDGAPPWLPDGGVLVLEDASHVVIQPSVVSQ